MNKAGNHSFSIIVAIFFLIIELFVLYGMITIQLPLWIGFLIKAILLILLVFFTRRTFVQKKDLTFPLLLLLLSLGSGVLGLACFLLTALFFAIFARFATPVNVWFEGLFPEHLQSAFMVIYQRIKSGWDDYGSLNEVAAFQDIFTFGKLSQKQAVLDAIVKEFNPIYAPILRLALKDPNNTVRIQASAIVSKIDADFEKHLIHLNAVYREDPENPKIILNLAEHYDNYSSLGIIDSIRKKEATYLAINYYNDYLNRYPDSRQIHFAIGRLLFEIGDYEGFITWYEDYRHKFMGVPDIVQAWYLESLYLLKRFDELSALGRNY